MAGGLVLFDIDGTLIRRSGPHHKLALVEAIRRVTGLETTTDHVPLHGMLDPDIIRLMLRRAGASQRAISEAMPEIIRQAQRIYVQSCPDLTRKVCPGVRRLLVALKRRKAVMGLVTGNLTRIGWKKIERAGLRPFFRFGCFGEMGRTRAGLVRLALREARHRGWLAPGSRVWLVGDAPADVLAAQAAGVGSIAVATGVTSIEELASLKPDRVLRDLRSLRVEEILP